MKPVGFLAYPGVEELDLVGPWEMATMWRDYADGPDCVVIAAEAGPVACAKGLSIGAHHGYADAPDLSALLIPGGFAAFESMKDVATLDYVRAVAGRVPGPSSWLPRVCLQDAARRRTGKGLRRCATPGSMWWKNASSETAGSGPRPVSARDSICSCISLLKHRGLRRPVSSSTMPNTTLTRRSTDTCTPVRGCPPTCVRCNDE